MIAAARAVVAPGGVLALARSAPPLTIRQVRTDDPQVCALCLVGSAAGPLPGDRLDLEVDVGAGARAELGSAGAAIAQGRAGAPAAVLRTRVTVGPAAALVSRAEPLVVCAGSAVTVQLRVDLAETATLVWRELVVLGRAGEPAGAVVLDWDVRRGGRPLLRQRTDLTAAAPWDGLVRGCRVLATELHVGPEVAARTVVRSPTTVAQRLADGAELRTVLAPDAATALAELAALDPATATPRSGLVAARGE